jgi:hypothetical protein
MSRGLALARLRKSLQSLPRRRPLGHPSAGPGGDLLAHHPHPLSRHEN